MTTYSLSAQGQARLRRRSLGLVGGIGVAAILLAAWVSLSRGQGNWTTFAISLLVVVGFLGLGAWIGFRLQRGMLESLRIELADDYIAWRQARAGEVRLRREEVRALRESAAGLQVLTADRYRSILVPRALDASDYAAVRDRLAAWAPLEPGGSVARAWEWGLAVVAGLGAFAVYLSPSPWLVLVAGLVVLAFYVFVGRPQQRAAGTDPVMRRLHTFVMAMVLLYAAFRVCLLFGWLGG